MTSPGAQVSGPGALSKRTDTGGQPIRHLPDPKYGEAGEFAAQQKAAPLSAAPAGPQGPYPSDMARQAQRATGPQPAPTGDPGAAPLPGLFDPGDPSIPVTSGSPMGPGPNSVTGGAMPRPQSRVSEQLSQYATGDGSEAIAWLANSLAQMGQ